uniref:Uncharacterized protein LOC105142279 n=1 Tax=Rhizophora mucronata TaxID=61149 RepID=A0A2P2J730_RHIMU
MSRQDHATNNAFKTILNCIVVKQYKRPLASEELVQQKGNTTFLPI